jgi:hypothetical protein
MSTPTTPRPTARRSIFPTIWDLDAPPRPCPGCKGDFSGWRWVEDGDLRILTHDGDWICPRDRTFGWERGGSR